MARRRSSTRSGRTKDWTGLYVTGTLDSTDVLSQTLVPTLWRTDRAPTEPTHLRTRGVITLMSESAPSYETGWGGRLFAAIYGPNAPASDAVNTSDAMGSEFLMWHDQMGMIGTVQQKGSPATGYSAIFHPAWNIYIDCKARRTMRYLDDSNTQDIVLRLQADLAASPGGFRYWISLRSLWLL